MTEFLSESSRARVMAMTDEQLRSAAAAMEKSLKALRFVLRLRRAETELRRLQQSPKELRRAVIGLRQWN